MYKTEFLSEVYVIKHVKLQIKRFCTLKAIRQVMTCDDSELDAFEFLKNDSIAPKKD